MARNIIFESLTTDITKLDNSFQGYLSINDNKNINNDLVNIIDDTNIYVICDDNSEIELSITKKEVDTESALKSFNCEFDNGFIRTDNITNVMFSISLEKTPIKFVFYTVEQDEPIMLRSGGLRNSSDISKIKVNSATYNIKDSSARASLELKQDTLVSGTNIKTINNTSLLGSGNINIQSGGNYTAGEGISINQTLEGDEISNIAGMYLGYYILPEFTPPTTRTPPQIWRGVTRSAISSKGETTEIIASGAYAFTDILYDLEQFDGNRFVINNIDSTGVYFTNDLGFLNGIKVTSGNVTFAVGISSNNNKPQFYYLDTTSGSLINWPAGSNITIKGLFNAPSLRNIYTLYSDENLSNVIYPRTLIEAISDVNGKNLSTYLSEKQNKLVSGTNIKTINNESLLGSGNISISSGPSILYGTTDPTSAQGNDGDLYIKYEE